MTSYENDDERFRTEERWREADRRYAANRSVLSFRYRFPISEVVQRLRSSKVVEFDGADGDVVSTFELSDAPQDLTDPEFADWAVQTLRSKGLV